VTPNTITYLNEIPYHVQERGSLRKGLTVNGEPNVCQPYASRDHHDELVPIPNGNADDVHERLTREGSHIASNVELDVLAEHNQK
jgi:hypothetical protein